ncbi:protein disulfide-isomerase A4-like [Tropilaelaps mercedesae]|uniref:protein disulfide-isomerase n=1 Tax=Tropilaelaps mercedesae TaxID=418985 RepID=A0A1V9XEJ2_9ACAR|nr:protein disulfide-isomerase A4-like [Tropilaelaps mercedesae]
MNAESSEPVFDINVSSVSLRTGRGPIITVVSTANHADANETSLYRLPFDTQPRSATRSFKRRPQKGSYQEDPAGRTMQWWTLLGVLAACSASESDYGAGPASADEDVPIVEGHGGTIDIKVDSDVLILTKDNFDIIVNAKPIILVKFYAPWCGHCQKMAPEYERAATRLKGGDKIPRIPLAKKGKHKEYGGGLTAEAIVDEMKKLSDPNYKPPPSAVKVLVAQNFSSALALEKLALVNFFAPWCGHCKQLEPELERAARTLVTRPDSIPIFKVDAIAEKDLAKEHNIPGYPTLFVTRYGVQFRYDGPRDENGIVGYMLDQEKSPSEYLERQPQLKNHVKRTETTLVVGAFESLRSKFFETFIEAANFERSNFTFVHTDKFDVVNAVLGVKEMDTIALLQPEWLRSPFETVRLIYTNSKASSQDLQDWFHGHCVPLVGHRTRKNLWKYDRYPMVVAYYDVNFSHEYRSESQIPRKEILTVARDYRDYHPEQQLVFAVSNEETFMDELEMLKLGDSPADVNVAFYASPKERYAMKPVDEFDSEVLRQFIEDVLEGKLKPVRKSQLAPKMQTGAARIVVGSTFEAEILKEKKDVFVLFYAPDCGHCKNFMADFKKIAKQYDGSDLKVAKLDAANNEFPDEFTITGYPTLFFVPARDKKHPIKFVGERTLQNVIEFIEKHRGGRQDTSIESDHNGNYDETSKKDEL